MAFHRCHGMLDVLVPATVRKFKTLVDADFEPSNAHIPRRGKDGAVSGILLRFWRSRQGQLRRRLRGALGCSFTAAGLLGPEAGGARDECWQRNNATLRSLTP
jgi:hypothetical protein